MSGILNKTDSIVYDPKKLYILSLSQILQNNPESIRRFSSAIKTRGWVFVSLPPKLVSDVDQSLEEIKNFFAHDTHQKKKFLKKPVFGYFDTTHKESFRFLTGQRLAEHLIPRNFDKIQNLINISDKIMYKISILCSDSLFPNIMTQAKKHNIPLFSSSKYWGMFDITKYYNDGTRKEINCEAHYDPGLLSIHLRSTEPGLQLQDENGKWINAPCDPKIGIIWAGDVATKINPQIHHGMHRVLNLKKSIGKPRIALWHEICTEAQEHTELINMKIDKLAELESVSGIPTSKSAPPPPPSKEELLKAQANDNDWLEYKIHNKNATYKQYVRYKIAEQSYNDSVNLHNANNYDIERILSDGFTNHMSINHMSHFNPYYDMHKPTLHQKKRGIQMQMADGTIKTFM
jgi:hypothetical protein